MFLYIVYPFISMFVDIQDSQVTSQVGDVVLHLTKYKTKLPFI